MVILHAVLCNKLQGTIAEAESNSSKMANSNKKGEETNTSWTIEILMELVHGNHRAMKYLCEWVTVTPHNLQ